MNRSIFFAAAAVCAVALSGCDWGGAHENTWSDAYSWLNFTGTYRLSNAVQVTSSTDGEDGSSQEVQEQQISAGPMKVSNPGGTKIGGTLNKVGLGVVPGSFSVNIGGSVVGVDDGNGSITGNGIVSGQISYASGAWNLETTKYFPGTITVSGWKYRIQGVQPDPKKPQSIMTYLHVNQNGNVLYMTDSNGVKYSGKITGASVPDSKAHGYEIPGATYVSFDVSSATGAHIVGTLNGQWSGSQSANSGVLSGRTINATYQSGRSSADFYGVGGDQTIVVPVSANP